MRAEAQDLLPLTLLMPWSNSATTLCTTVSRGTEYMKWAPSFVTCSAEGAQSGDHTERLYARGSLAHSLLM